MTIPSARFIQKMSNLPDIAEAPADFLNAKARDGVANGDDADNYIEPAKDMNHRYDKTHPDIRPYSMMTRTGYMEYNPMKNRGKLPEIYARVVGQYIGDTFFLQDINENQIQVSVLKKNNSEIYFTHGWSRLRDFYNINAGAWITLLLISPFVFSSGFDSLLAWRSPILIKLLHINSCWKNLFLNHLQMDLFPTLFFQEFLHIVLRKLSLFLMSILGL
ncbi:uncharacterized protein LOC123911473 [Trifolium pratense]|uniref:uncharacterized protein LOC123911473 n=1 Tax=Trifolium pratense TaxID=57577 RepID=UPI001E69648B|nr:uncharacterized protein LOC123911473 [Trifolium pratense]